MQPAVFIFHVCGCDRGLLGTVRLAASGICSDPDVGHGDAAAALVGIPFGKHKVNSKLTEGKKSWEGSAAMLVVSFITGAVMLSAHGQPITDSLLLAGAGALSGTIAELFSPSEYDTITVPVVIVAVLLIGNLCI